ncbi:MAG TPA: hypothetical protein PK684_10880 [Bacillota bacterium]|jgi:DNA-directed RNA polymerase specialized sigma24 family protein|nr:hypothetical protein [Bacillota bacterium]
MAKKNSEDLYAQTERWLRSYPYWKKAVISLQRQYGLRAQADAKVIATDTITGGKTNKVHSTVEDLILNLEDIAERKNNLEAKIQLVESAMELLTPVERKIIELRYFDRFSWWLVAAEVGYTDRHCKSIRTRVVHRLKAAIFGEDVE